MKLDSTRGPRSGKSRKLVLGIGGLIAAISIGSTLAANININSGPVEFGQGVAQTAACDDSIMISPMSSFVNSTDTSTLGSFMFTGMQVSDVDSSVGKCQGKTLTFKAYADTETAALATYTVFVGETEFLSGSGAISDSGVGSSTSSFTLSFDPATISASEVYKITVESSDGFGGVPSGDRYFNNGIIYVDGRAEEENSLEDFFEVSGMPVEVRLGQLPPETETDFGSSSIPLTNGSDLAVAIAIGGEGDYVWNSSGTHLAIGCHSNDSSDSSNENIYRICPGMTTDYEDNGNYVPTQNLIDADIVLDYSGILTVPNTEITYGSAISTVTTTVETYTVQVKNTFTLDRNSPFLKVTTRITNTGSESITNLRAWALNGDQMMGDDEADISLGNVSDLGMGPRSSDDDGFDANAIKASTNEGSAIMYSSTADAAVLHSGCCSLENLIYRDPAESNTGFEDVDGSYGLYFRLNDLGAGASHEFTWFFGATTGSASTLAELMYQASRPDVYTP